MRKLFFRTIIAFVILSGPELMARTNQTSGQKEFISSAYGVISRVLPGRESSFQLRLVDGPSWSGDDAFEVNAAGGVVTVEGNSAIALTRGVYYYLRHAVHAQFTWQGEHIDLPKVLPDFHSGKIVSPYKYRLYYNVCAFGYTTPFWGWKEWRREIDWMALHGINMPLAMAGQEAIWQRVWEKLGLTKSESTDYFTGPAFLPWNRMGNVDRYQGPLPQEYIEKSETLQKKILNMMRSLGMSPIVPGFSGYVPQALEKVYPDIRLIAMKSWGGFKPIDGTYMLSPLSKHFIQIGKMFIRGYRKTYGYTHFYLADAFNEMTVPVSEKSKDRELTEFGKAIYSSITAGDPKGVWVMQGWLFYNDREFWDRPSVKAFLQDVPDNRMIIIDLANESFHGWKELNGFFGKEWIYSIIHNFGGRNQMFGNLPFYASNPIKMLSDPKHGNMVGFGISPEGIDQNEVVYELLTDMEWIDKPVNLDKWIASYCKSRYGAFPENMKIAWKYLLKSIYSSRMGGPLYFYQHLPMLQHYNSGLASADFDKAAGLFLSCSKELEGSELYRDDAIEMAAQYASVTVDSLLNRAVSAQINKKFGERDSAFTQAFTLLKKIDYLLRDHPLFRLKRWVDLARKWGNTTRQKDYYERDAKLQITVWGGGPGLSEYAAKVWSGLIDRYYVKRWEMLADSLEHGTKHNILNWEMRWNSTPIRYFKTARPHNPVEFAKSLVADCKEILNKN